MNKIKILFLSFVVSIALIGCGSVKKAFDSERKNSTDEFLVEKKKSLSFPPNYRDLPKPIIKNTLDKDDSNEVKSLILSEEISLPESQKINKKLEILLLEKIDEDNR
tara:strand:+ start:1184 stop:1504 length:321 start_codon:yes stop_codon:yes gene_type:complete